MRLPTARGAHTHSDRLERWLGAEKVAGITAAMRDFYWPIPMHGVPGRVFAMPGGDFCGEIRAGSEVSAVDRAVMRLAQMRREGLLRGPGRRQVGAFANFAALVAAATTGGKRQDYYWSKSGVAGNAIGNSNDLWTCTGSPIAGAAAAAAPGGTAFDRTSTGAIPFLNATVNANTTRFLTGYGLSSQATKQLLLYDRTFAVAKTMNSTAIEGVTGVPTRYQNSTTTAVDYIGGSFCFPSVPTTILAGTAHNWVAGDPVSPNQGCTYINQAGVEKGFQQNNGISGAVLHGIDLSGGQGGSTWFMQLAAGDVGVRELQTMQCSALVATGTVDFVIGHILAWFPCPIASGLQVVDGLYSAFNLATMLDNCCPAFLEPMMGVSAAANYTGMFTTVSE